MNPADIQKKLFEQIKAGLPPHRSLADELCDVLGLSPDSVYRRLRGETTLNLNELQILCSKYNISLDHLLSLQNGSVLFQTVNLDSGKLTFTGYLNGVHRQLAYFNQFPEKEIFYLCKDMPLFYFFHTPELAAFKSYFWMRSIVGNTDMPEHFPSSPAWNDENFAIGKKIIEEYNKIPSIELWNLESINSTIRQIEYYREAGVFESAKDIETIYDAYDITLSHLRDQCRMGAKFFSGKTPLQQVHNFRFFVNELILGNNTVIAKTGGTILTFISHSILSYMSTTDQEFGQNVLNSYQNLVNRSTMISEVGEKERNRFFSKLRGQILNYKNRL